MVLLDRRPSAWVCIVAMSRSTAGRSAGHNSAAVAASAGVIIIAVTFYTYALSLSSHSHGKTYQLDASFLSSSGLKQGADVVLAGVTVGKVNSIGLNRRVLTSEVIFEVSDELKLPVDTRLSIGSSTLTSSNALMLTPGTATEMLRPGAMISRTCELSSLEQQVSQYIFGSGGASTDCGQ